ncbi:hypothetical protein AAW12_14545 [Sphingobacterium sp. Ag1]|uniref:DUF5977 domain-containing protein n=1 Tax=Sphingobacterium sp. Ag1 TaxID=1643451 RepID=UPI0006280FFB|nr:DUF5977 domain-containing protein [Sphingobacterium sp. Ag1]KKO90759.1 hypothetical protein AAW12_14545 [Sphingobacterium sp. Ag1]
MKFIQLLNRHTRKIAAIWGAVFLLQLVSPMAAVALTAGPTAPEATSFEPVDTTDMVNPLTGSFTYNLPLLEIPGPEGAYPLSLSYHAGIRPDVEASWVGLGWTLNPGAINRNVAGFPDDFNDVSLKRRDYWSGGNRKEYGLEVGFASMVNVGLVFATDTYRGFGIGASIGYGFKMGALRASVDVGIGPYGGGYAGMAVSSGVEVANGIGVSSSLGLSTNFNSVGLNSGMSVTQSNGGDNASTSLLSGSMSTSSNKTSLSVMGASAMVYNDNANKISTSSSGFGLTIPIGPITVGVSFRNQRYWIDETAQVNTSGTLYTPIFSSNPGETYMDNRTYDNYRLLPDNLNIVESTDDEKLVGGTFPEYDNYSITGQGIGGQIRPFLYQRALSTQNMYDYKSLAKPGSTNAMFKNGVGFRFVNDFSNSFDQALTDIVEQDGAQPSVQTFPFDMAGNPDNRIGNELAGSKHIKYFTNDEIINGTTAKAKGFIDVGTSAKGFTRLTNNSTIGGVTATRAGSQIGGFMVTNESGMTYHYALPVYTYGEYSYNYTSSTSEGFKYTSTSRDEPYAYTWLLTAVTGADYVDRNGNGLVDDADWGYWVAMDYGKWTDDYIWRTPAEGKDHDIDQKYELFSMGKKQLFYLNKIRSRTHTAFFEKEVRFDGKGTTSSVWNKRDYNNEGGFDSNSAQSLKLNKIYLLNNADISTFKEDSSGPVDYKYNGFYNNIIDTYDVAKFGQALLESKSIRVIDFGYDYSLVKNTPNSFRIEKPDTKLGKLTLNGIHLRGKGGADLLPVTRFSYEQEVATFKGNIVGKNQFTSTNPSLQLGTMVEKSGQYVGMIVKIDQSTKTFTLANGADLGDNRNDVDFRITKNPDYCKDCHDIWGFYKGDLNKEVLSLNEDFGRRVTATSAVGTDAWNLRKISSPTGANIELDYESNDYSEIAYNRNLSFPISSYEKLGADLFALKVPIDQEEFDRYYFLGEGINAVFILGSFTGAYIKQSDGNNNLARYNGWTSDGRLKIKFDRAINEITAGNIRVSKVFNKTYGGGPRIKNIKNKLSSGVIYKTDYVYNVDGYDPNTSTGVTSYVPYGIEVGKYIYPVLDFIKQPYKLELNNDLDEVLKYAREIPGPGVMYFAVTIKNSVIQPNGDTQKEGYTENFYRKFDRSMIKRQMLQERDFATSTHKYKPYAINLSMRDFTTNVGDLRAIYYYDSDRKLVKEINNTYILDKGVLGDYDSYRNQMSNFSNQGLVVERFAEARFFYKKDERNKTYIVMAAREQFPSILLSSTTTDYINGSSETKQNIGFDFLNGQLTQVLTRDSYGNRFMTETKYAYKDYAEMGSKLTNSNYKNMLTQVSSQVNYKVDANNNKTGVISGNRSIWSKIVDVLTPEGSVIKQNSATYGNIWRKQREDVLEIPDQYANSGILPVDQLNSNWKAINTVSLYNVFSKALEDYDRNNNYSANRYGYKNSKIVAGANFSKYKEIAFSGAEDELSIGAAVPGEVFKGAGTVSSSAFHTGSKSLSVPANANGFEYTVPISGLTAGRIYQASVWVKNSANGNVNLYYDIDGTTKSAALNSAQSTKKSGDWSLVNLEIPITTGTQLKVYVKNDGTAASFIDDFRFHPKNVSASAYVYDSFSGELIYILDHLNLFTRFEYDAMGKLVRTYKEQFGRTPYKTNEYQMNYGSAKTVYYNDYQEDTFRKNNCPSNVPGPYVNYSVSSGTYSSKISKEDANNKALADISRNGQNYANANGDCAGLSVNVTFHNYTTMVLYVNISGPMSPSIEIPPGQTSTMLNPGTYTFNFVHRDQVNADKQFQVSYYATDKVGNTVTFTENIGKDEIFLIKNSGK